MQTLVGDFYAFGPRTGVGSLEPVRGRPFCADYEETHVRLATGETLRQQGVVCRDGSGRVRRQFTRPARPGSAERAQGIVIIFDPSALAGTVFLPSTGGAQTFDMGEALRGAKGAPGAARCPLPSQPQGSVASEPSREILGRKTIEGFSCHGIRLTVGQEQSESWIASELVMLLLEETASPDFKITYRVFNIKLDEPDANLFLPPES